MSAGTLKLREQGRYGNNPAPAHEADDLLRQRTKRQRINQREAF